MVLLKVLFSFLIFVSLCYGQVSFYIDEGCQGTPMLSNIALNQCLHASEYVYIKVTRNLDSSNKAFTGNTTLSLCKNANCDVHCTVIQYDGYKGECDTGFLRDLNNSTDLNIKKYSLFVDPNFESSGALSSKVTLLLSGLWSAYVRGDDKEVGYNPNGNYISTNQYKPIQVKYGSQWVEYAHIAASRNDAVCLLTVGTKTEDGCESVLLGNVFHCCSRSWAWAWAGQSVPKNNARYHLRCG
ncbi:unnamed protein product [Cunninghamella echinulata]